MRFFCFILLLCPLLNYSQAAPGIITGNVLSATHEPISGASVRTTGSRQSVLSGADGSFRITARSNDTLIVSHIGYVTKSITVNGRVSFMIQLEPEETVLTEVTVNTGYQQLKMGRITGSFVQLDSALLNRKVSTNILDRLDGVTSGLLFNKTNVNDEPLSIRGRSTLLDKDAATPLIVLDNFPYEGDIANINPNNVESITVLKDAAAAAIWGSRSGNGVIVITTKKGSYNQPLRIDVNVNTNFINKPDLFYSKNYLSSTDYIDVEQFLFSKGYYDAAINNTTSFGALTPVVELLAKKRAGTISSAEADAQINALRAIDVRSDFSKFAYQPGINRQYALSFTGGSQGHAFRISASHDNNSDGLKRNGFTRTSLSAENKVKISSKIDMTTTVIYAASDLAQNNQFGLRNGNTNMVASTQLYPYASLRNPDGTAAETTKDYRPKYTDSVQALGFQDWRYRLLDEIALADNHVTTKDLLLKVQARYKLSNNLSFEFIYQNQTQNRVSRNNRSPDSYYTRNLINRFTQRTAGVLSYPFPKGGILEMVSTDIKANSGRLQLNYYRTIHTAHFIQVLAGGEMRETVNTSFSRNSYGYDNGLGIAVSNLNFNTSYAGNPSGSYTISALPSSIIIGTRRYLSAYANGIYSYQSKYSVSLSARSDGANLFGTNVNQKFTPLWSAGLGWDITRESNFRSAILDLLKARASFGYNGNTYIGSSYLTAQYYTSALTGLQIATISTPPNPDLRWEKVRNINAGIDFGIKGGKLSGSIDIYRKDGIDLVEDAPLAPTSGYTSVKGNAASTRTKGIDLQLQSVFPVGKVRWQVNMLLSSVSDKVIRFDKTFLALDLAKTNGGLTAVEGKSLFGMYAYRSAGLDPTNGDPMGYVKGSISKDYVAIIQSTPLDSLVYYGSARPELFGAIRNTLSYKGISLTFNITAKFKYFFRSNSTPTNYVDIAAISGHADFTKRWQNPGDEAKTTVPSPVYPSNANRNIFYQYSEPLMERGDHIRLQDIQLSFSFDPGKKLKWIRDPSVYVYASNIGILWRSNQKGYDPDANDNFSALGIPQPFSIAMGIKLSF